MDTVEQFERTFPNPKFPDFQPGDSIRVFVKITEGEKTRVQPFEGVVIGIRNRGNRGSFTVRKVSYGIGVERSFPIFSPNIQKVQVVRRGHVRRAKLYYLRQRSGKAARIREKKLI